MRRVERKEERREARKEKGQGKKGDKGRTEGSSKECSTLAYIIRMYIHTIALTQPHPPYKYTAHAVPVVALTLNLHTFHITQGMTCTHNILVSSTTEAYKVV